MASAVDRQMMSASDLDLINQYRADWNAANAAGDKAAMQRAHDNAQAVRAQYGYQGDGQGNGYNGAVQAPQPQPQPTYQPQYIQPTPVQPPQITPQLQQYYSQAALEQAKMKNSAETKQRIQAYLDQGKAASEQQVQRQIDYAVQQGTRELQRAEEDAQPQFQAQRDQIARDEAAAKSNAALYAEMRGDRGGIGQEQYSSIMNTAAINRQAVNSAQVKLSTDTARAISDLRSKGEFEKADKLLEITQSYLSQLVELEQWAANYDLSVAQFNENVRQWGANFYANLLQFDLQNEISVASLTGSYRGMPTMAVQQYNNELYNQAMQYNLGLDQQRNEQLASMGTALLQAGIMPNAEQLAAMGMTQGQASTYVSAVQAASSASVKKGGGGGNGTSSNKTSSVSFSEAKRQISDGVLSADAIAAYKNNAGSAWMKVLQKDYEKATGSSIAETWGKMSWDKVYYNARNMRQNGSSRDEILAYILLADELSPKAWSEGQNEMLTRLVQNT